MSNKPGAPPMFEETTGEQQSSSSTHTAPPYPVEQQTHQQAPMHNNPPYPVLDMTPQSNVQAPVYTEPPPSYQNAMAYPAYAQPAQNPAFPPKPQQPPYYYQPPVIQQTVLPQPPPQPMQPSSTVVVTVTNGFPCRHCNAGTVVRETDMCCVICLILLAIFTFPFGLLFLCCLPCAVQNRCSSCGRITA